MFRTILIACIIIGLSAGVLSCALFLSTWLAGSAPASVLWIALLGVAAIGVVLFRSRLESIPSGPGRYRVPVILFFLVVGGVAGLFIIQSGNSPHGGWDAWAIWNLHARFLYRGGEQWTDMFTAPFSWAHSDYPLLLPSLVASGWTLIGSESTTIPALIAMFFTFGTLALLVSSVAVLGSVGRALAAGLIVLATSEMFLQGSFQLADVPLGFFILLTIVLFYLSDRAGNDGLFLGLAGMSAGFAAWTKNEGLLFLVAIIASRFLVGVMHKPLRAIWREIGMFCCGLAPVLSVVAAFKMLLSPANEIVSGAQLAGRLTDPERYIEIGTHFLDGISTFGAVRVTPVIGAAAYGWYLWRRNSGGKRSIEQLSTLAVLGFTLAGYFLVYVISPFDLEWHLNTSFQRLLLHLWPTFVFCIACSGLGVGNSVATTHVPVPAWKRRGLNAAIAVVAAVSLAASLGVSRNRQASTPETVLESVVPIRIESEPVSVTVRGEQAVQSGHARFVQNEPDAMVAGLALLNFRPLPHLVSEAALPAAPGVRAGVLPFRFDRGYKTSIAIANPNDTPVKVTFSIGANQEESFDVPANGQAAVFLDEAPFNARTIEGTLLFRSSLDIAVSSFLTFQGKDIPFLMAGIPVANPDSKETQPLQIPYFAGGGNRSTELWLVNPTPRVLTGRHRWYGEAGGLVNDASYSIPPHASVVYGAPGEAAALESGRIEILPTANEPAPYATAVLFVLDGPQSSLVTVHGAIAARDSSLYVESSNLVDTEISIANPSSRAVQAKVGLPSAGKTYSIPPGGFVKIPIGDLPGFGMPARGIVHVTADSELGVAALRNLTTSIGRRLITVYGGNLQNGSFFTQLAAGGSFTTEIVLFADSPIPTSGLLRFFSASGEPLSLPLVKR